MKKNQLFRKIPDETIIKKVLLAFGYNSLTDTKNFSRKDLEKIKTVEKITELKTELEKYYLPCKSRSYLNGLNEKNVITVLRQCIKTCGYSVFSKEKYLKGDKFIVYTICPIENKNTKPVSLITKSKTNEPFIIKFD